MKYGVTKKYALCFLIEALGLAGIAAEQEELGSNTIYFGDEVRQPPYTSLDLSSTSPIYFGDEVRPRAACTPHARAPHALPCPSLFTD